MTGEAKQILQQALELAPKDRAALASSLIDSLDTDTDEEAEESWKQEIARRIYQLDSGEVDTVSWEDLHRRLAAKLENAK